MSSRAHKGRGDLGNEQVPLLETLVQEARRLARDGNTSEEAIKINTEILEIDPSRSDSYTRRGICYQECSDWDAAEEDFRKALAVSSKNRVAQRKLSEIQQAKEKFREDELLRDKWRAQGLSWSSSPRRSTYGSGGEFQDETFLYTLGYSIADPVSRRNLSRQKRWQVLTKQALPVIGLQEVVWTISNNCRNRKRNDPRIYAYAIAEWEHDLARLRRVFYHEHVASWPWPSTEP
jgi:tetratricopeptide (TPR) repeat protein